MKRTGQQEKAFLLVTAKAVATRLKANSKGTCMRIRIPHAAKTKNTQGWAVSIGDLGKDRPRLSVWYDRFSGYPERKLCACFQSDDNRRAIISIARHVTRKLWPIRVITVKDISNEGCFRLARPLQPSEFSAPIREEYDGGQTFFGLYDPTSDGEQFCSRAVAFFEDVVRSLPSSKKTDEHHEVYPQHEDRKHVASHLTRERSRLLATERKIKDHYECQVCGMSFKDVYGIPLGRDFAEAHHLVPLSKLQEKVKTRMEDLRTVCANCHRMLHRMDGKAEDIKKLAVIVRKQTPERGRNQARTN